MLVDVFRLRVPDLFLVDAVVGMEGNGPASPELREIGLVLASDNAVALDSVIATMMGCDPARLRFLQKARELGLGDYDIKGIEIIGELKPIPDFKLPPLGGEGLSNIYRQLIHSRTVLRPQVDPDLCTGCGTCVDQCPVSALSMGESVPRPIPIFASHVFVARRSARRKLSCLNNDWYLTRRRGVRGEKTFKKDLQRRAQNWLRFRRMGGAERNPSKLFGTTIHV